MSAVVVIARLQPRPGSEAALQSVLEELIPAVHEEPGCTLYALHRDQDGGDFVFVERYVDAAAFSAHENGSALAEHGPRLNELLVAPAQLTVLDAIAIGDGAKGAL